MIATALGAAGSTEVPPAARGQSPEQGVNVSSWSMGDRLMHAARPEWGVGQVLSAQHATHEGSPCQRLTVRFERAGIKTLSTGVAELLPASEAPSIAESSNGAFDPFAPGVGEDPADLLARLPEPATDPFRSLEARLCATLGLYRFQQHGSSLLDWAAAQTGLRDPLTRFSRHELEAHFSRYAAARETHLRRLIQDAAKQDPGAITRAASDAPPDGQQALKRFHKPR